MEKWDLNQLWSIYVVVCSHNSPIHESSITVIHLLEYDCTQ